MNIDSKHLDISLMKQERITLYYQIPYQIPYIWYRLDEAIEILEHVVGIREEKLGTANPDVDDEKRRLAELLKEAGRVRSRKARSLETLLEANPHILKKGSIAVWWELCTALDHENIYTNKGSEIALWDHKSLDSCICSLKI